MSRTSLVRRLFGFAKPVTKPIRRSKLAIESLEQRDVPAQFSVLIQSTNADPAQWTITGDGDGNDRAFFGTPFTTSWIQPIAGNDVQIAQFRFAGDVNIIGGLENDFVTPRTVIDGASNRPISLLFGSNLTVGPGVVFDFAAHGFSAGPGGGIGSLSPGAGGLGSAGGAGGAGGLGGAGSPGQNGEAGHEGGAAASNTTAGPGRRNGQAGSFNNSLAGTSQGGSSGSGGAAVAASDGGAGGFGSTLYVGGLNGGPGMDGESVPVTIAHLSAGDGRDGVSGVNAPVDPFIISGGAGGGSGGSGGGGVGGHGGGGGGGGGGGSTIVVAGSVHPGGTGGNGGQGGNGGAGGNGGQGGLGGSGGGALEIIVNGMLTFGDALNAPVNLNANGAAGEAGRQGSAGAAGAPGQTGGDPVNFNGGSGGQGGNGGRGQDGAPGGNGGAGGSGAGGTIKIVGSVVAGQAIVDVSSPTDAVAMPAYLENRGAPVSPDDGLFFGGSSAAFLQTAVIGGAVPFSGIDMTYRNNRNTAQFALIGEYWNGSSWQSLPNFADETTIGGVAFARAGRVSWSIPADWQPQMTEGGSVFTIRLKPDARPNGDIVADPKVVYPSSGRALLGANAGSPFISAQNNGGTFNLAPAFAGPKVPNPFVSGDPYTPYLPDLVGGAEIFGLTTLTRADFADVVAAAPPNAGMAVYRTHVAWDTAFSGYDFVFVINLGSGSMSNPQFGVDQGLSSALLQNGPMNNPLFNPIATGPITLGTLAGGAVYATLVPSSSRTFHAQFDFAGPQAGSAALANGQALYVSAQPVIQLSNASVAENQLVGTIVGTFSTSGPGGSTTGTYAFAPGFFDTNNASFTIDANGNLRTNESFDFEGGTLKSIRVRSNEGAERVFFIGITNVNETPTGITLSSTGVAENMPAGTVVGRLSTLDPDAGDTHTYAFIFTGLKPDNSLFEIVGDELRTKTSFDFEAKPVYSIAMSSVDANGLSALQGLTINVTNVNETPTDIALSSNFVAENQPAGTVVGRLSTLDPDGGDTHTYTFAPGFFSEDNSAFTIDADGTLRTAVAFDSEAGTRHIHVRSTDAGGLFVDRAYGIAITNVNEAPTIILLSNDRLAENQPASTVVGRLSTLDPDAGDSHTYSLVAGKGDAHNASFTIDADGTLRTAATFDYEAGTQRVIRVRSTDAAGLFTELGFSIAVTDANDAPSDILLSSSTLAENLPSGTVIATLSTLDQDSGDTHTYSLVGPVSASFSLSPDGTLRTVNPQNFEAGRSPSIRVRSTDAAGLSTEKSFTFTVTDVNEAPTGIILGSTSLPENLPLGTVLATLGTLDPDAGDTHTYSLVGPFSASFSLSPDGTLRTVNPQNFEAGRTPSIRVRSTDAAGLSTEQTFTFTVTNVNETPTDIALSGTTLAENRPAGTVVGRLTSTDPDAGDMHAYSLVGGDKASFTIDGAGNLKTTAPFDFEGKNSYSVRVRSTDAGGLFIEEDFIVSVTNVNDAPTLTTPATLAAYENVGQVVSGLTVGDQEGNKLKVTIMVGHGTLTVATTARLTVECGRSGMLTLSGSVADVNAALATLTYRGARNLNGDDWMSVTVSDGSQSATSTTAIHVTATTALVADLKSRVDALVLNRGLITSLKAKLDLKGNYGDTDKVQSFLGEVAEFLRAGRLTAAQGEPLTRLGRILLSSVSPR